MGDRLRGLFRFERLLAALLTLLPVGLLIADTDYRNIHCPAPTPAPGPMADCRDSISAYHDMADAKWFFVPLTIAAIMFIINGLVRTEGHAHNTWLGFALLGVLAFDVEGETVVHYVFAVTFFVSAIVFIAAHIAGVIREGHNLSLGSALLVFFGLGALQVLIFAFLWRFTTLFVAEWVQLVIIAVHFIWHSLAHRHDHPDMPDPEPLGVLKELLGPIYAVIAAVLTPATFAWRWITGGESS